MLHLRRPSRERLGDNERSTYQKQKKADEASPKNLSSNHGEFLLTVLGSEARHRHHPTFDLTQGNSAGCGRRCEGHYRWTAGMPFLNHGSYRIRYELDGPANAPAFVLVNGLTQYAELWAAYRDALVASQFRVATFDLLGQGTSDKPALFINQDDQVAALDLLIGKLGDGPVFLSGISFGGLIALRYAIAHGKRLSGLVPMSCFAELSPQLLLLGNAMRTGLILGGTSYLQDLLLPMNLSDQWLRPLLDKLDSVKRQGWLVNDVYALQNLMESFLDFEPLTPQLGSIAVPTMILNGEFDFLTPRALHETLRVQIPDSSLVIIPRAYHAFTLEKPALTADLLARFAEDVLAGRWQGNKAVWIAPEEAGGELAPFPAGYDHLRAIPTQRMNP
jgi:pimeloyl-ACP methyl ester carboxylesterase